MNEMAKGVEDLYQDMAAVTADSPKYVQVPISTFKGDFSDAMTGFSHNLQVINTGQTIS